jgi:23S rRNA pseudouridine2605 synthase
MTRPEKRRKLHFTTRAIHPAKEEPGRGAIRLNRFLSMCGVASRRKADELILQGKVEVDGRPVMDLGSKIDPSRNKIFVDGKQVAQVHEYVYLVMNKPRDTITTTRDERGRATVMDLLRTKQRVYPVGRLDRNTTGVLLLTNDGDFANMLMHPRHEVPKSYIVTLDKPAVPADMRQLARGVRLKDGMTAPAEIHAIPGTKGKQIGIIIREGRNRQVRRMFEALGYDVRKLDRVAYGPVTKEGLARGASRPLTPAEIRELKNLAAAPAPSKGA